jgi:GT2 family glycosyltransferase
VSVLKTCVYSILEKTAYPHYELLLVDNDSREAETLAFLSEIVKTPSVPVRVLADERPFNFSAINNLAVSRVDAEMILFLNNDTEVITPDWLEAMLEHAQRPEVGCVGALLYYPDDTVQHAGVILGLGGIAGHSHSRCPRESFGYMGRLKVIHNLSGVTAACMMMRRAVFDEAGGYDENISHAFNDVDLCLRVRERGYRIVYTPFAELYHHESLSRGYEDTPEKQKRFVGEVAYIRERWGPLIEKGDPYYNPNMSLDHSGWTVV